MTPDGWRPLPIEQLLVSVATGVSVNSQSRPRQAGETGVLKISAVTYGAFRPEENKSVLSHELDRAREHPKKGCVLVSRANTQDLVGASVFVPRDYPDLVLPDKLWQLYPAPAAVDGRWLQLALSSQRMRERISEVATGTSGSMKNISREKFLALDVLAPPIPEQRKIAAILSSVDEAIEGTQAVIDQLQVVKKAMMADLLTRGIPGRHKKFKQTEIGEVPAEWEVVRLGDVGHWMSGGTPSKQEPSLWAGSIPWVSPKDMKRPRISDAIDHVSEEALKRGTQLAPVGSVLMVVRGMILAHTFPVAVTVGPVAFNQDIKALVPAKGFQSDFMLYWLQERGSEILNLADVSNHGTKRLPSELLFDSKVPRPSMEEQTEVVAILQSFDGRLEAELLWMAQLRGAKSALMSVLLTGEVRVRVDEEAAA